MNICVCVSKLLLSTDNPSNVHAADHDFLGIHVNPQYQITSECLSVNSCCVSCRFEGLSGCIHGFTFDFLPYNPRLISAFTKISYSAAHGIFTYCCFQELKGIVAAVEWISTDEVLQVSQKDRQYIYIFEEFEGAAFEHVMKTGNRWVAAILPNFDSLLVHDVLWVFLFPRIYGPTCILHSMKLGEVRSLSLIFHKIHYFHS